MINVFQKNEHTIQYRMTLYDDEKNREKLLTLDASQVIVEDHRNTLDTESWNRWSQFLTPNKNYHLKIENVITHQSFETDFQYEPNIEEIHGEPKLNFFSLGNTYLYTFTKI